MGLHINVMFTLKMNLFFKSKAYGIKWSLLFIPEEDYFPLVSSLNRKPKYLTTLFGMIIKTGIRPDMPVPCDSFQCGY